MTDGATPQGRKAYEILAWVQADPLGRAARGIERLSAVAGATPDGPALREVQGVGTMLHRLLPPGSSPQ